MTEPTPPIVTALNAFAAALRPVAEKMNAALREAGGVFSPERILALRQQIVVRFNDPVNVAGLEGRYAVRAGLDPAYATPEACGRLVRSILNGRTLQGDPMYVLTPGNRALVAAAAIRGWEAGHPGAAPEVLAWHRQHGDTRVLVGRA